MDFGIFNVPYSLKYAEQRKSTKQVIEWDLLLTKWGDEFGLSESYFAEHYTIGHEPSPAPDLMIAAASQITDRIGLGAAAHLLPYHNPMNLAYRMMWLDHMTEGRYIAGIAPGSFPTDAQVFGTGKRNPEMMREALDIILAIWTKNGPFRIEGEFWTVDMPEYTDMWAGPHMVPLTSPHPPLAIVGMQPTSPSLTLAGSLGAIPISQELSSQTLRQHWDAYSEAALENGHDPSRSDWRVLRDFFVAETDEEAYELVVNGAMGELWREHNLLDFKRFGVLGLLADVPEDEVTVEYLAENFWIIGSPDTVVEKVTAMQEETGGFQTLLSFTYDYQDQPDAYRRSFELLGTEVIPRVSSLGPEVSVPTA